MFVTEGHSNIIHFETKENHKRQETISIILKDFSLPIKQKPIPISMPASQTRKNIFVAMLIPILAFTTLVGLTIAGVTNAQIENENIQKDSDLNDFDINSEEESLSLVKRTADSEAQRFRQRVGQRRQLNNFSGASKSSFSLPNIVNNEYTAERWNGTWVSDIEFAYRNRQGDLAILR